MRTAEYVEGLLEIAVVDQCPAVGRKQRLVAGMRDGGLFQHGSRLAALSRTPQRLAVGQGRFDILGVGTVSFAGGVDRAMRIGLGARRGL